VGYYVYRYEKVVKELSIHHIAGDIARPAHVRVVYGPKSVRNEQFSFKVGDARIDARPGNSKLVFYPDSSLQLRVSILASAPTNELLQGNGLCDNLTSPDSGQ